MRHWLGIGLLVINILTADGAAKEALKEAAFNTCTYCHSQVGEHKIYAFADFKVFRGKPFQEDQSCSTCHLNNSYLRDDPKPPRWVPLDPKKIPQRHAYTSVPPLVWSVSVEGGQLPRFTDCGLDSYLQSPSKRHRSEYGYMFPVLHDDRLTILKQLTKELADCALDLPAPQPKMVFKGAQLFHSHACHACHTQHGPDLRIGKRFFSLEYFSKRLKLGSNWQPIYQNEWHLSENTLNYRAIENGAATMPAYPGLKDAEVEALFHFVSFGQEAKVLSKLETGPPSPGELASRVFRQVFDGTCRHCHSPSAETRQEIARVFASRGELFSFPTSRHDVPVSSQLQEAFSLDEKCGDSLLLQSLQLRHHELEGLTPHLSARFKVRRGMPLTQEPLSPKLIEDIRLWSKLACPNPQATVFYCKPCSGGDFRESLPAY